MGSVFVKNISENNFKGLKKNINSGILIINTPQEDDMVDVKINSPSIRSTYQIEHEGKQGISFHKKHVSGNTPELLTISPSEAEECFILDKDDHKHHKKSDHCIICYFKPNDNIVENISILDDNNDIGGVDLCIGSYNLPFYFNKQNKKWIIDNVTVPIFLLSDKHDCCLNIKLNNKNIKDINMSYTNYDISSIMMDTYRYKKFKCGNIVYYDGVAY
jgi:hypothetical protein